MDFKITQAVSFKNIGLLNVWLREHSFVEVEDIKYQVLPGGWDFYLVIFKVRQSDLDKVKYYMEG